MSRVWQYYKTSLCIVGHQYLGFRILQIVISNEKWPPLTPSCMSYNTCKFFFGKITTSISNYILVAKDICCLKLLNSILNKLHETLVAMVNKIFHHPYIIICHMYITIKINNLHINDMWQMKKVWENFVLKNRWWIFIVYFKMAFYCDTWHNTNAMWLFEFWSKSIQINI